MASARRPSPSLREVLAALAAISPLEAAADWDNVGLLLEPPRARRRPVARIGLCIDLTEAVLRECRRRRADLLVCYHPPLFAGVKRLTQQDPQQRALLAAAALDLPIWSPHTALDVAPGGVNDWLAHGLGGAGATVEPCGEAGFGRLLRLRRPLAAATLLQRVRRLLRITRLRIGRPPRTRSLRTIAVCAGAGGSVLRGVPADALVTGEMRHHDALLCTQGGALVVLSEHSHTERAYLPLLARTIVRRLDGRVAAFTLRADREPLTTV